MALARIPGVDHMINHALRPSGEILVPRYASSKQQAMMNSFSLSFFHQGFYCFFVDSYDILPMIVTNGWLSLTVAPLVFPGGNLGMMELCGKFGEKNV